MTVEPRMRLPGGVGAQVKVFVSMASADARLAKGLAVAYFASLRSVTKYSFDRWWMYELLAGEDFDRQIKRSLSQANLGLVLISANLLGSPYVREFEAPRLLNQRHRRIIPVMLRDVPAVSDYLGFEERQIYGHGKPYSATTGYPRELWINGLVNETVKILDKYGRRATS